MTTIDQAKVVFAQLERDLRGNPQVSGIEIAALQDGDIYTDDVCVRILVNSPSVTRQSLNLPKVLDGVVIEVKYSIIELQ